LLPNNGNVPFQVAKRDRIAQIIIEKITTRGLVQVLELPKTEQSKKGFGLTGSRNTTLQSINIDEGNGANVQPHTTLQDKGNRTTQYYNIYMIYHEIDEFPDEWINAKTSHSQVLYKKYQGQIEDKLQESTEDLVP